MSEGTAHVRAAVRPASVAVGLPGAPGTRSGIGAAGVVTASEEALKLEVLGETLLRAATR